MDGVIAWILSRKGGGSSSGGSSGRDGKSIEYHWRGTELGIRQEGEPSFQYTDLKGEKGKQTVYKIL